jgi:hypothetical protein
MSRCRHLLLLGLLLLAPPCLAQPGDLPSEAAVKSYLQELLAANQETIAVGDMQVRVMVVPDAFPYLVATDYLLIDFEDLSEADAKARVVRLAGKHKKSRGKAAIFLRFEHPRYGPPGGGANVFALEGKISKKVKVTQVGRGAAKFKVTQAKGRIELTQFTLFQAQSSDLFKGGNVPPVIKRKYFLLGKDYALDLLLKKPLHEKTQRIKVGVSGFIHFSGNVTQTQMDFTRGARATYVKGGQVEFRFPMEAPPLPAGIAAAFD